MMIWHDPILLFLIPLAFIPAIYTKMRRKGPALLFSSGELVKGLRPSLKVILGRNTIYIRCAALILIILALARPQSSIEESVIETEGIDIVLAVDVSTSMLAEDFKIGARRQNRLEVAKRVMEEFVGKREHDRIGLVAFAGRAYTVCPLTLDYGWLLQNLDRVEIGIMEDGTAIGSGLSSALNRLRDTEAKSKIIILLTDGINNAGRISPTVAAEAAKTLNIKVYTVGAGTRGTAPYPMKDMFGNIVYQAVNIPIDDKALTAIAEKTGGTYFRATDTESLRKIYSEIDSLEKTPIKEKGYMEYIELFGIFLMAALALIILEILLNNT
ncbi:MAG: VWA domain-containing protein, partial [Candidatus Omnitrophota bacterium]